MKILFLQNSPDVIGGVEIVNKTLAEGFFKRGYKTGIFSLRLLGKGQNIELSKGIETLLVNDKDLADRPSNKLALKYFCNFRLFKFTKQMIKIIISYCKMSLDCKKMKSAVFNYNPDLIVVSYVYMLNCIPKTMLNRAVIHIHTNYQFFSDNRFMHVKVNRYKNRIKKLIWNVDASAEIAINNGLKNSIAIYNPLRLKSNKTAAVSTNKKAIYVGRISPEKQVDLIIKMFNEILEENGIDDWGLDIFGIGEFTEESIRVLNENPHINYCGSTIDPVNEYLQSSLLLIASKYESFSLVVFEANECGVPAIAFDFGEPTIEAIINNKTGIVIKKDDVVGYKRKLLDLMKNPLLIEELAANTKQHAKLADAERIIDEWERKVLI